MPASAAAWLWISVRHHSSDAMQVTKTPNAENPIANGSGTPLLTMDVWEHAYCESPYSSLCAEWSLTACTGFMRRSTQLLHLAPAMYRAADPAAQFALQIWMCRTRGQSIFRISLKS